MPFVQISQSEWLIFVGRKISGSWKLFGQLKLTENATDKNLSENACCFFDQEAMYPHSCLI